SATSRRCALNSTPLWKNICGSRRSWEISKKSATLVEQKNNPSGILLVNKTAGTSSFYLVSLLRRLTKVAKIGHAGTLDPFATGVMVMLIGRDYTKKSDQFLSSDKE